MGHEHYNNVAVGLTGACHGLGIREQGDAHPEIPLVQRALHDGTIPDRALLSSKPLGAGDSRRSVPPSRQSSYSACISSAHPATILEMSGHVRRADTVRPRERYRIAMAAPVSKNPLIGHPLITRPGFPMRANARPSGETRTSSYNCRALCYPAKGSDSPISGK